MVNIGNVTIDLQGFSIRNLSVGPATAAVGIEWVNRPNVTVRNGSIQGFSHGIHFESGGGSNLTGALIENVRFVYITNNKFCNGPSGITQRDCSQLSNF